MPASTEQVLHPDRYASGDAPLRIVIDSSGPALHQDVLGEMETRVLVAELLGSTRPDVMVAAEAYPAPSRTARLVKITSILMRTSHGSQDLG